MLSLNFDSRGHLQGTITLTLAKSLSSKYFTLPCLFYKASISPQRIQLDLSTVFCDAFNRRNKPRGLKGQRMSVWALGLLLRGKTKSPEDEGGVCLFLCFLCFVLFMYMGLCGSDLFFLLLKKNRAYCCVLTLQGLTGQETSRPLHHVVNN